MNRLSLWGMDPNETGYVILCCWMAATGLAVAQRSTPVRVLALAGSAALMIPLGLTASRGAFLAAAVFATLTMTKTWGALERRWRMAAVGFACVAVMVAFSTGLWNRSRPAAVARDVSIGSRIDQWKGGLRVMASTSHGVVEPEILVSQFFADEETRLTFKPLASTTLTLLLESDDWARVAIIAGALLAIALALAASDPLVAVSMSALVGVFCAHTCNYLIKPTANIAGIIAFVLVALVLAVRIRSVRFFWPSLVCCLSLSVVAILIARIGMPPYPVRTDGMFVGSRKDGSAEVGFMGYGRYVLGRFWGKEIRRIAGSGTSWSWTDYPRDGVGRETLSKWGAAVVFAHESRMNEPVFEDGHGPSVEVMLESLCAGGRRVVIPNPSSLRREVDRFAPRITVLIGDKSNAFGLKKQYELRGYRCVVVRSAGSNDPITKDYLRIEDIFAAVSGDRGSQVAGK